MNIHLTNLDGDFDWSKLEFTDRGRTPDATMRFYGTDVVVPGLAWRKPTEVEVARHGGTRSNYRPNIDLGYFRVPEEIVSEAIAQIGAFMRGRTRPMRFNKPDIDRFGVGPVVDYCRFLIPSAEPWGDWGLKCDAPRLETVTVNPATGAFVGLHIDSYTLSESSQRNAHVRFVVNLGPPHRYLLFGLKPGVPPTSTEHTGEAWKRFKAAALSEEGTPIGRLRLEPGEGYTANTEALVHDASSVGTSVPCTSLHIRCNLREVLPEDATTAVEA